MNVRGETLSVRGLNSLRCRRSSESEGSEEAGNENGEERSAHGDQDKAKDLFGIWYQQCAENEAKDEVG